MNQVSFSPVTALLARAETKAARSVRLARRAMANSAWLAARQTRLRRFSFWLACITPALLLAVMAGSLAQTNSALVETLWEITAGCVLIAGVAIAMADSGYYYVRPLGPNETPDPYAELIQLAERSADARTWLEDVRQQQGRPLCQFDLEIMWALADDESA